jgi:hypothetical protein
MPTDCYSFPYVAAFAGDDTGRATRETQARVAQAAKAIIAVSPAEHIDGGKVPGADLALSAAHQLDQPTAHRRAHIEAGVAGLTDTATALRYDGPEMV